MSLVEVRTVRSECYVLETNNIIHMMGSPETDGLHGFSEILEMEIWSLKRLMGNFSVGVWV